jgi:hypothetical protein
MAPIPRLKDSLLERTGFQEEKVSGTRTSLGKENDVFV